jgi:hypothetical protein
VDPHGTPVWQYLATRGIALSELSKRIDALLRWHPHCPGELAELGTDAWSRFGPML